MTRGLALVAQSGGPTTVINGSLQGVVEEAGRHPEITGVLGAKNGILGVLFEELFDFSDEDPAAIARLRRCPSAATGSCRYKLKAEGAGARDFDRVLEVFRAHDVRFFFYNGGNDSMDTADRVNRLARERGYDLAVVGVPKTIDNDLAHTDHTPGFGSVAKMTATFLMESGKDTEALYTADTCTVVETMGRNAGWIAASAALARRSPEDAPHLVYVPEIPFTKEGFVEDVKRGLQEFGRCVIAASEGIKLPDGTYVAEQKGTFAKDSFGHAQLGGVAETLRLMVEEGARVKCRSNKPGTALRDAMHFASKTDVDESYACGVAAVKAAFSGGSGNMVTLVRKSSAPYRSETGLASLRDVANGEKFLPRDWMNKEGNFPTKEFLDYARPLVQGQAPVDIAPDGLPDYARLKRRLLQKKCPSYVPAGLAARK